MGHAFTEQYKYEFIYKYSLSYTLKLHENANRIINCLFVKNIEVSFFFHFTLARIHLCGLFGL